MKRTASILLMVALWSPMISFAQVGGTTVTVPALPILPAGEQVSIIGSGFDDASNQVYVIFSGPVAPLVPGQPVTGFTLWVNNIVRPLVNSSVLIGSQSVEAIMSPVGIDIDRSDSIRVAYSPSTNPLVSRGGTTRVNAIPVTNVTNGLVGDTSCPRLQKKLLGLYPSKNIFVGYFDERIGRLGSAFQEYGSGDSLRVGTTSIQNSITLSLGSNIATRTISALPIDWSVPVSVAINNDTTITDSSGNKACNGIYELTLNPVAPTTVTTDIQPARPLTTTSTVPTAPTAPVTPSAPVINSVPVVATQDFTPSVDVAATPVKTPESVATGPSVSGVTIVESTGPYKPGAQLTLEAAASEPLDKSSQLIVELNSGSKKVLLKTSPKNPTILTGTFVITKNMISTNPVKVSRIIMSKLVSAADTAKINSVTTADWLDATSPNNIAKEITIVAQ